MQKQPTPPQPLPAGFVRIDITKENNPLYQGIDWDKQGHAKNVNEAGKTFALNLVKHLNLTYPNAIGFAITGRAPEWAKAQAEAIVIDMKKKLMLTGKGGLNFRVFRLTENH